MTIISTPITDASIPTGQAAQLQSRRLLLRRLLATDVEVLMPILGDEDVTRFLPYPAWATRNDGVAWCAEFAASNEAGSTAWFVCIEKASNHVVGACVLFNHDAACARAEIGYLIGRAHWKLGFAQEAVAALAAFGFMACGIHRIEAQIHVANVASQQLALKLGFQREGLLRKRLANCHGQLHDVFMFSLLKQDIRIPG
jgi:ribosomal-protein-alanine N-acetyltransferase